MRHKSINRADSFVAGFIGSSAMSLAGGELNDGKFYAEGIEIRELITCRTGDFILDSALKTQKLLQTIPGFGTQRFPSKHRSNNLCKNSYRQISLF